MHSVAYVFENHDVGIRTHRKRIHNHLSVNVAANVTEFNVTAVSIIIPKNIPRPNENAIIIIFIQVLLVFMSALLLL